MNSKLARFSSSDWGFLLIRLMLAAVFLFHGSQKLFGAFGGPGLDGFGAWLASLGMPLPEISAFMAAATEFVGGLALLLGIQVRWAALPLAATMFVAAFTAHSGFDITQGGMEYPLTLAFVTLGLALTGGGRLGLRVRGKNSALATSRKPAI